MKKIFWALSLLLAGCKNDVSQIEVIEEKPKLFFGSVFNTINENLSLLYKKSQEYLKNTRYHRSFASEYKKYQILNTNLKGFLDYQKKMKTSLYNLNEFPFSCLKNMTNKDNEKFQKEIWKAKQIWLSFTIKYIDFKEELDFFNQEIVKKSASELNKLSTTKNYYDYIDLITKKVKDWDYFLKTFKFPFVGNYLTNELKDYCPKSSSSQDF